MGHAAHASSALHASPPAHAPPPPPLAGVSNPKALHADHPPLTPMICSY